MLFTSAYKFFASEMHLCLIRYWMFLPLYFYNLILGSGIAVIINWIE